MSSCTFDANYDILRLPYHPFWDWRCFWLVVPDRNRMAFCFQSQTEKVHSFQAKDSGPSASACRPCPPGRFWTPCAAESGSLWSMCTCRLAERLRSHWKRYEIVFFQFVRQQRVNSRKCKSKLKSLWFLHFLPFDGSTEGTEENQITLTGWDRSSSRCVNASVGSWWFSTRNVWYLNGM